MLRYPIRYIRVHHYISNTMSFILKPTIQFHKIPSSLSFWFSGYANHLEQQWRPPQWGAATTSRLGSKGKYVFASRRQQHQQQPIRRSSMEIGEYSIATPNTTNTGGGRVLTSSNNSTVLPGGPYLHYTTIPRRLRPLSKVSCIYVFLSVCMYLVY